jgi:hypothetical protein
LWKSEGTGGSYRLAPEEGMNRMFIMMIPAIWKTLRNMIMGMRIMRGNDCSMNRGEQGDKEEASSEASLSKGGEHDGTERASRREDMRALHLFNLGERERLRDEIT